MPLDKNTRNDITNRLAAYNRKVTAIRNNPNLSDVGKKRELAKLYATEQAAVNGMRETARGNVDKRRADLEKQLFAVAAQPNQAQAISSYRDAQVHVAKVKTGAEAQLMMRRAIRTGDTYLAQALFNEGWERAGDKLTGSGWGEVVDAYVGAVRPDLAPAVQELATLQQADSRKARFEEQIGTSVNRPPELQGMTDYDMRGLLAEDAPAGDAA